MPKPSSLNASIDCNMNEDVNRYIRLIGFPPEVDLTLSTILLIIGAVAVIGNMMAFYYFIVKSRKERSLVKPLYINLAAMDCVMGILTIAYSKTLDFGRFKLSCMLSDPYTWGWELLQLSGALFDNLPKVSLNLFAVISLLRLYAVVRPFSYRYLKRRSVYLVIGICYGIPVIMSLIPLFGLMSKRKFRYSFNSLLGFANFAQAQYLKPGAEDLVFKVFYIIVPLFVPAMVILVTSIVMFKYLTRRSVDSNTTRNTGPARTMLIMAIYIFATKLPVMFMVVYDMLQTLKLITTYKTGTPSITFQDFYVFFPVAWAVDCLSSALNPFIYHIRSAHLFDKSDESKSPSSTLMTTMRSSTVRPTINLQSNDHSVRRPPMET